MQEKINKTGRFLLNFRFLINKTGLQDQEIAEKLGIHKVSISRYFSEKRIPKRTVLEKIAAYFNLPAADLLEKDLQSEKIPQPTEHSLQNLLELPADIPLDFQRRVEHKLAQLQQQINNTVCELLNEFAKYQTTK